MGEHGEIGEQEIAGVLGQAAAARPGAGDADASFWDHERRLLADALLRAGQNQTHAARLLKISREQLRTRMKRYDLFAR
jgi:transcriptional regulator with GAF, ATPase, and Fis domain